MVDFHTGNTGTLKTGARFSHGYGPVSSLILWVFGESCEAKPSASKLDENRNKISEEIEQTKVKTEPYQCFPCENCVLPHPLVTLHMNYQATISEIKRVDRIAHLRVKIKKKCVVSGAVKSRIGERPNSTVRVDL